MSGAVNGEIQISACMPVDTLQKGEWGDHRFGPYTAMANREIP